MIHQIPGDGAEPILTATILSSSTSEARFTIAATPTSPPICVPPHCFPHSQGGVSECEDAENVKDQSPPICVPPHCYPHQHNYDNQIESEVEV